MGNLEVKVENGVKELLFRQGRALPLKEPVPFLIHGTIDTVSRWLEKKKFDDELQLKSSVMINRERKSIALCVDEKSVYSDKIQGSIMMHPEFVKWGINDDSKSYTSQELALKVKMNRYMFSSLEKAAELVTVFQNLKAKVNREIENSNDGRGNARKSFNQVVESMSIPEKFTLITPIFKGDVKRELEVEIVIDPSTLNCSLISPDAITTINNMVDDLINKEIEKITELAPGIAIIEI